MIRIHFNSLNWHQFNANVPFSELTFPCQNSEIEQLEHQFHLLIKQRILGLPIDKLLSTYPRLAHWLKQLEQAAPEFFTEQFNQYIEFDTSLQRVMGEVLLEVNCDALVYRYNSLEIVNWTAYPLQSEEELRHNWPTGLSLFLAATTSTYFVDEITITYWFVTDSSEPVKVSFNYNPDEHEQFKTQLKEAIKQLKIPLNPTPTTNTNPSLIKDYLDTITEVEL